MSDIKTVIEEKLKPICELREEIQEALKSYLDAGISNADVREAGEVADIIKDLAEAEESIAKSIYHKQITIAMEDAEYGTDYDYQGAYKYYGTRSSRNRMAGDDVEYWRDVDRAGKRTMYYTDPRLLDSRAGKSGASRVRYYDTKSTHMSGSDSDSRAKKDAMSDYFDDLKEDIVEMTSGEASDVKTMVRQSLMSMANAIV